MLKIAVVATAAYAVAGVYVLACFWCAQMARLGKRERELKRATIKANMNSVGPAERTPTAMRSHLSVNNMLGRTHTGFRDVMNAKGSEGGRGSVQRFSEPAAIRSDNRAAYAERYQYDSRREHEARKAQGKAS